MQEPSRIPEPQMGDDEIADLLVEAAPRLAQNLLGCRILENRKKMRKRIVHARVTSGDRAGRERSTEIVLKLYGRDRGAASHDALAHLHADGFGPPSAFLVPEPFGYSHEHGALVQGFASGTTWADHLGGPTDELDEASVRAADWLARLHATDVPASEWGPYDDLAHLHRHVRELEQEHPGAAPRLERLADRIAEVLPDVGASTVVSHGDYHAKNVYLDGDRTTVIDFDTFGRREVAFDVAYAIAQLLIISHHRMGSFEVGGEAAIAFWRRYLEVGRLVPVDRVAVQAARAFLQSLHYELCVLRNGRTELLELWPDLVERWLAVDGLRSLEDRVLGR